PRTAAPGYGDPLVRAVAEPAVAGQRAHRLPPLAGQRPGQCRGVPRRRTALAETRRAGPPAGRQRLGPPPVPEPSARPGAGRLPARAGDRRPALVGRPLEHTTT